MRAAKLAADSGRTFLTTYAAPRGLLAPVPFDDPSTGQSNSPPIVADFFRARSRTRSPARPAPAIFSTYAESTARVASMPASGETDPTVFSCGKVDDLGVALTGLHPKDVWLMRFEANLPRRRSPPT